MEKDYDDSVTTPDIPRFQERRILFLTASGLLAVNFLIFALLSLPMRKGALILAALTGCFAAVQCTDKRTFLWSWGYLIVWFVIDTLVTAAFTWVSGIYWFWIVLAAELMAAGLLAYLLLKQK